MKYERMTFFGGEMVAYKYVDEDPVFPFAELTDKEFQVMNPVDYMEHEGQVSKNGFWYPIDEGEELWYPIDLSGSSVLFVDDTETLPFADVTNEELQELYTVYYYPNPLDYEDPWEDEVYDLDLIE
jgi:hypothetical protein